MCECFWKISSYKFAMKKKKGRCLKFLKGPNKYRAEALLFPVLKYSIKKLSGAFLNLVKKSLYKSF